MSLLDYVFFWRHAQRELAASKEELDRALEQTKEVNSRMLEATQKECTHADRAVKTANQAILTAQRKARRNADQR